MHRSLIPLISIMILISYVSISMAQEITGKKETPSEQILVEKGGILLPKGTLQIEPSFQYSNLSRHTIAISGFTLLEAIVIGQIAVSDVKRDILQGALTARYGITPRFEAEVKVPGIYRADRYVKGAGTTDATETHVSDVGLGDIEGALFYHAITGKGWIPDIVLNVRGKSTTGRDPYHLDKDDEGNFTELPTGTGHWGLSGGFTAVKVSDPAVFFGSVNYFWNLKKNVGNGFGKIDPGDSVELSMGIAYALSEKVSLNTQYQQRLTQRSKQNGSKIPGTFLNAGVLFLGTTYAISSKTFINVSAGIGLTTDAPDVQVAVSVPLNIKLF